MKVFCVLLVVVASAAICFAELNDDGSTTGLPPSVGVDGELTTLVEKLALAQLNRLSGTLVLKLKASPPSVNPKTVVTELLNFATTTAAAGAQSVANQAIQKAQEIAKAITAAPTSEASIGITIGLLETPDIDLL